MGKGHRLVVDIGGNSIELIIGESLHPPQIASAELSVLSCSASDSLPEDEFPVNDLPALRWLLAASSYPLEKSIGSWDGRLRSTAL